MLNYADHPVNSVSRYSLDPDYFLDQPLGCPPETKVIHEFARLSAPDLVRRVDALRSVPFVPIAVNHQQ